MLGAAAGRFSERSASQDFYVCICLLPSPPFRQLPGNKMVSYGRRWKWKGDERKNRGPGAAAASEGMGKIKF